jgi:hypothetical protein
MFQAYLFLKNMFHKLISEADVGITQIQMDCIDIIFSSKTCFVSQSTWLISLKFK